MADPAACSPPATGCDWLACAAMCLEGAPGTERCDIVEPLGSERCDIVERGGALSLVDDGGVMRCPRAATRSRSRCLPIGSRVLGRLCTYPLPAGLDFANPPDPMGDKDGAGGGAHADRVALPPSVSASASSGLTQAIAASILRAIDSDWPPPVEELRPESVPLRDACPASDEPLLASAGAGHPGAAGAEPGRLRRLPVGVLSRLELLMLPAVATAWLLDRMGIGCCDLPLGCG